MGTVIRQDVMQEDVTQLEHEQLKHVKTGPTPWKGEGNMVHGKLLSKYGRHSASNNQSQGKGRGLSGTSQNQVCDEISAQREGRGEHYKAPHALSMSEGLVNVKKQYLAATRS